MRRLSGAVRGAALGLAIVGAPIGLFAVLAVLATLCERWFGVSWGFLVFIAIVFGGGGALIGGVIGVVNARSK